MITTKLKIIFIDVGWGDSILIEATDTYGVSHFALVDCNDTTNSLSGSNFLKRYFERQGRWPGAYRVFKYVFTTHAHNDHVSGVQGGCGRLEQTASTHHAVMQDQAMHFRI